MTAFDRRYAQPLPSSWLGGVSPSNTRSTTGPRAPEPSRDAVDSLREAARGHSIVRNLCIQRSSVGFERVRHFVRSAADESALLIHWQSSKERRRRAFVPGAERFPIFVTRQLCAWRERRERGTDRYR